jgi:hypothetical protein
MKLVLKSLLFFLCFHITSYSAQTKIFRFSGEGRERVKQAIEDVIKDVIFLKRPFARSRLTETNQIPEVIRIEENGQEVSIRFNQSPPRKARVGDSPVKWITPAGKEVDLRFFRNGENLQESLTSEKGVRTNTYEIRGDILNLKVVVQSPQLPQSLIYNLTFTAVKN